jgi:putative ABC transport system substrate-binding protein
MFLRLQNGTTLKATDSRANVEAIRRLALHYRLPWMYGGGAYVSEGGLMTQGPDSLDLSRRAASYADRILRGAKPSELPVQYPAKFELVVNLKTARTLGLEIPATLLALADEVIE